MVALLEAVTTVLQPEACPGLQCRLSEQILLHLRVPYLALDVLAVVPSPVGVLATTAVPLLERVVHGVGVPLHFARNLRVAPLQLPQLHCLLHLTEGQLVVNAALVLQGRLA